MHPDAKALKRSTRQGYRTITEKHLIPAFGHMDLSAIDASRLERYVAGKRRAGFQPRTINRQLNLLHEIYVAAVKRKLVRENPVTAVDRPREPRRRWRILTPIEIASVARAFAELAEEAEGEERRWREQARTIFLTVIDAGLRRGEVLGLHWRDVELADPEGPKLHVRETWVCSASDTPKSEAGERTIALDDASPVPDALFQHRRKSPFNGGDDRVFTSQTGAPFDTARYAKTLRLTLERAEIVDKIRPFHDGRHTAITNDAASGMELVPNAVEF